ncbi:helix-turn-helix domain-containing protein [Dictyobacter arantiisoli]|uniref:Helix-turn-helix domain-containing protein n=1 Tax=Dictyobacter arantiisoli TaxID=2014874 RepID=A0A5A5T8H5_9CHLR|nr:helix-turn-helix domain-containing protein [Dictyobacter arantiisoli]GCF07466.1 hypothetical protein KDI_10300 [Dictyobacter arantiisoli]
MVGKPGTGRFAFIDAGDAARRLGVDRITLEGWIKEGRLKARSGVGRDVFFRASDVEALYNELHPASELAEAVAEDEQESAGVTGATGVPGKAVRKQQDPQMRVYLRLQADAKWYDISDEDIQSWFKQLAPDGYERNKRNVQHTQKKLQAIVDLIEDAQKRASEQG